MSPTCGVTECKRISCATCHCCQKDICLFHLKEHQAQLISELSPLVERINILDNRANELTTDDIISKSHEQLVEWRKDCYKKIDDLFEKRYDQIKEYGNKKANKHRENINEMRSMITKYMDEQEVTRQDIDHLSTKLHSLEKEMTKSERTNIHLQTQSLTVNENMVQIEEINSYEFDLSANLSIIKTINSSKKNWGPLATNDNYLLVHQESSLCIFNRDFELVKQIAWSFGEICDMFWSPILKRFLVINENAVYLIDNEIMGIESIEMLAKHVWCCGTCSSRSLYLATYTYASSIIEFNLFPSIEFIKQWKSPDTCSKDEVIHDINYQNEKLLLIIENRSQKEIRLELKSVAKFDRIWSLSINSTDNQNVQIRCCLFNYDEWLIACHDSSQLLHITRDGKLKSKCLYTPAPHFVSTFGTNLLIISTLKTINLHKLQL